MYSDFNASEAEATNGGYRTRCRGENDRIMRWVVAGWLAGFAINESH